VEPEEEDPLITISTYTTPFPIFGTISWIQKNSQY
jgi:hypothetical protein